MIEPLGFLSSSISQFTHSGNLFMRSPSQFPPHTPTLSGIYSTQYDGDDLNRLQLAGPFWAKTDNPQSFYVPVPFNYLIDIDRGRIRERAIWNSSKQHWETGSGVFFPRPSLNSNYWIPLHDWHEPQDAQASPWVMFPLSHTSLAGDERRPVFEDRSGRLFRENVVQMHPDTCLVYLSNLPLADGWYRFGGESHTVSLSCCSLHRATQHLLSLPPGHIFALITPAVWGSNRLSYSEPAIAQSPQWQSVWEVETILSSSPKTFRYRLGGKGRVKRLSRGRYSVPAGSVYIVRSPLDRPWQEWPREWFPTEAYSFKRWGCGLVLPLDGAIAPEIGSTIP
ncbi:hypothetical protein [Roseofilum casamattae]|uniref:CRISPR-associated protein Cmr3 n=1 Tax=Roseofilum casamattae BLCC-M143 TaxID=3022442 RepID=A0ABT7BSC1_9CYAN|nr:hypothetical protein [Roseofilum casamattae]MDJ1182085.1 CRISPR-associated protein Cmr3 [Roseofilum casamattae BLCC-M143]